MVMVGLVAAVLVQAPSVESATKELAACAEGAAPFVAKLDETMEVASQILVEVCPTQRLSLRRAVDGRGLSPQQASAEETLLVRVAIARARVRMIAERACGGGEPVCWAFFSENNGVPRP